MPPGSCARTAGDGLYKTRVDRNRVVHHVLGSDALLGAGIPCWRDRAAYAAQHSHRANEYQRRHAGRVHQPATALYRSHAEQPRPWRLHYGLGASRLAGSGAQRVLHRVLHDLHPRLPAVPRYAGEARVAAIFPPGFTLLSWHTFFLGLIESFFWSWYIVLAFGPIDNFFLRRAARARTDGRFGLTYHRVQAGH